MSRRRPYGAPLLDFSTSVDGTGMCSSEDQREFEARGSVKCENLPANEGYSISLCAVMFARFAGWTSRSKAFQIRIKIVAIDRWFPVRGRSIGRKVVQSFDGFLQFAGSTVEVTGSLGFVGFPIPDLPRPDFLGRPGVVPAGFLVGCQHIFQSRSGNGDGRCLHGLRDMTSTPGRRFLRVSSGRMVPFEGTNPGGGRQNEHRYMGEFAKESTGTS